MTQMEKALYLLRNMRSSLSRIIADEQTAEALMRVDERTREYACDCAVSALCSVSDLEGIFSAIAGAE